MRTFLLILLLVCFGTAKAQRDVGGFFHATAGVSRPSGDFKSTSADNPASGYAGAGASFKLLFGHKIHKQFGAFAMLSLTAHGVNSKPLESQLNAQTPNYTWTSNQSFWTVTGFTFGPQFSQNFKKMAIDVRLAGGVLNFISSNVVLNGVSSAGGPDAKYQIKDKRSSSGIVGGGMTLKYEFKWSWVVLVNADLFYAKPVFAEIETVAEFGNQNPSSSFDSFEQEFRMTQIGLGIGYVF